MAMRNTQNATSMIQTADGALGETVNILVRMKDLATQAADASATADDKKAMQAEFDTLTAELTNVVGNTSFGGAKLLTSKATANDSTSAGGAFTSANGIKATKTTDLGTATTAYNNAVTANATPTAVTLAAVATTAETMRLAQISLDDATKAADVASAYATAVAGSLASSDTGGKFNTSISFQIGASTTEKMGLDLSTELSAMHTSIRGATGEYNAFGLAANVKGAELTAPGTASTTIDKLQTAIDAVGTTRSALGAAGNRLDHVATNLANVSTNTQAASGRIMDTDFATESSNMTASQMLLQAGTAMLKQSNSMSSMVMSLLQ